jgi:CheY-like chemotaxis protein/tetratricopeptide (TPR) repeat protein
MTRTILYIDDTPELPEGTAEGLEGAGYRLLHTPDAKEALRVVRQEGPRVVLLEVLTASCDGLELMQRIRSCEGPAGKVPVLIVTRGMRSPHLYGMAIELGANDFLCKPVLRAELLAAVLEHAEGDAAPSQVDPEQAEPDRAADPAFTADLAQEPLPVLLDRLHRAGATGVLIVRGPAESRGVQLRNGSPVAVVSRRTTEALEDHLLRIKRISEKQHEEVVEQAFAQLGTAQEILVGMGALTEDEIETEIAQRATLPLLEMFAWTSGTARFEPGRRLKASQALELDQSPAFLLFDGVLQWSPHEMVRQLVDRVAPLYVSRVVRPASSLSELGPSACEPEFLETLLGDRTLSELLDAGGVSERVLYGLLVAGLIEVHVEPVLLMVDRMPREPLAAGIDARLDPRAAPSGGPAAAPPGLEELSRRASCQDDFEVLDVEEDASDEEVREAYRCALQTVQLGEGAGQTAAIAGKLRERIEQAYDRLREPDSRQAFAALRSGGKKAPESEETASRQVEAENWFRKGAEFLKAKRYDKAVEALGMAAHLDPKQGEYAAHLGYALFRSNPYNELVQREALEHVAKGIKLSPDREKSLVFLGRIFKTTGETESAIKVFRRALKIKPDCREALQELRILNHRESKPRSLLDRLLRR